MPKEGTTGTGPSSKVEAFEEKVGKILPCVSFHPHFPQHCTLWEIFFFGLKTKLVGPKEQLGPMHLGPKKSKKNKEWIGSFNPKFQNALKHPKKRPKKRVFWNLNKKYTPQARELRPYAQRGHHLDWLQFKS